MWIFDYNVYMGRAQSADCADSVLDDDGARLLPDPDCKTETFQVIGFMLIFIPF